MVSAPPPWKVVTLSERCRRRGDALAGWGGRGGPATREGERMVGSSVSFERGTSGVGVSSSGSSTVMGGAAREESASGSRVIVPAGKMDVVSARAAKEGRGIDMPFGVGISSRRYGLVGRDSVELPGRPNVKTEGSISWELSELRRNGALVKGSVMALPEVGYFPDWRKAFLLASTTSLALASSVFRFCPADPLAKREGGSVTSVL